MSPADNSSSRSSGRAPGARSDPDLLAIYLNDHLAGATAGVDLAHRAAKALARTSAGPTLSGIADEIAADRDALLAMMKALDAQVRTYKVYLGWAAEKAGRLKLNGRLLSRSPLSSLVELEGLAVGIQGKIAGWRTLRVVAEHDNRLDTARLDSLLSSAEAQSDAVEALRVATAEQLFGSA